MFNRLDTCLEKALALEIKLKIFVFCNFFLKLEGGK